MKRFISVLAVAILVFVLIGCGGSGGSDYVGNWELTKAEYDGTEIDAKEMGFSASVEIKEDGKATFVFDSDKTEGTWEEKDGKVLLTEGESDPLEAELEDGNLVIEQDGGKMIFEKK